MAVRSQHASTTRSAPPPLAPEWSLTAARWLEDQRFGWRLIGFLIGLVFLVGGFCMLVFGGYTSIQGIRVPLAFICSYWNITIQTGGIPAWPWWLLPLVNNFIQIFVRRIPGLKPFWRPSIVFDALTTAVFLSFGVLAAITQLHAIFVAGVLLAGLRKGCRIEELSRAIRDALMADEPPPVPPSGMLARLQQHALDREMRARHADTPRIALFASDPVIRLGLVSLLSGASVSVQGIATGEHALRSLLRATQIQALLAAGQDRARALLVAREFAVPIILIVATHAEAQMLQDLDVAGVVVSSEGAAALHVGAAIEALANGTRWLPAPDMWRLGAADVALDRAGADLTPQERKLLALDGPGVSPEWLAEALHVSRSTIRQYRSRVRRKMADAGLALP